ncbi:hypothetical protein D3C84_1209420 [compost metagenome]
MLPSEQYLYTRGDRSVGTHLEHCVVTKLHHIRNPVGSYTHGVPWVLQTDFLGRTFKLVHCAQSLALSPIFQDVEELHRMFLAGSCFTV